MNESGQEQPSPARKHFDVRVVRPPDKLHRARTMEPYDLAYDIAYGTAFAIDGFGFRHRGKLTITEARIRLEGPKLWPSYVLVGLFFAFIFACFIFTVFVSWLLLILFPLLIILLLFMALVGIDNFCTSRASLQWQKGQVQQVVRKGRVISFVARVPELAFSNRLRKALFRASDETVAADIARQLSD